MTLHELPAGYRLTLDHLTMEEFQIQHRFAHHLEFEGSEAKSVWHAYVTRVFMCNQGDVHLGQPFCRANALSAERAVEKAILDLKGWLDAGGPWPIPEGVPGR